MSIFPYKLKSRGNDQLYTPEQRILRDNSVWTLVQGVLAPLQFLVFLISLFLVLRFMWTGSGYEVATLSILIKTGFLLLIMVTGAIWEKVVFGQYLFADAFFWEDVFSFLVIAFHLAYVWANGDSTRSFAASPASSGCTGKCRMRSFWWWGRGRVLIFCNLRQG